MWSIYQEFKYKQPNYTVAIAAVSGLDPTTDRPVLDPEFSLTVSVMQRSPISHRCGDHGTGTAVQVSYHGFELASAATPQVCQTEGTWTVIARGSRVWLPGPEMDSLAADIRRDAGVFDVVITIPNTASVRGDVYGLEVSCMARRIGQELGGGAGLCDVRGVKYARSTN
jgi:hypothetical protein